MAEAIPVVKVPGGLGESPTGQSLQLPGPLNEAAPVSLASAGTVDLGAATANTVNITGSVTINSWGTVRAGVTRTTIFGSALTLTYNATSMILPGSANIPAAAGDVAKWLSLGSGNWRCIRYMRANGQAITGGGFGVGESNQDMTASRAAGTTYTNSTGQPIGVEVVIQSTAGGQIAMTPTINGVSQGQTTWQVSASGFQYQRYFVVPPGHTYSISTAGSSATPAISRWNELRP